MSDLSQKDAWRAVVGFGLVSLTTDVVAEGMRSISGPLLASLGATAVVVGLVTGASEAMSLILRLVSGPWADRTRAYWPITILGYAMTAVCIPLLAITPKIGAAGLGVAITLILLERAGKAVRSPAKSALLAEVAHKVGNGKAFGVHKALDETGAFLGPLLVAAIIGAGVAATGAMAWLAIPGAMAVALLFVMKGRTPEPAPKDADAPTQGWWKDTFGVGLPKRFFAFAASAALTTAGLVTFGVISYHLSKANLLPLAMIPVVYAAAQAASGLVALANGFAYDKIGGRVLYILPVLVFLVPVLAFTNSPVVAIIGVLIWGAASGLQDSTVKAIVADLVEPSRRATAYGVFAAIQGIAAIVGGAAAGALYESNLMALIILVGVLQVGAAILLAKTLRKPQEA